VPPARLGDPAHDVGEQFLAGDVRVGLAASPPVLPDAGKAYVEGVEA